MSEAAAVEKLRADCFKAYLGAGMENHRQADAILVDFLRGLGYHELADVYGQVWASTEEAD